MSWYAIVYVALFIAGAIFSAYDDIRGRVARWYVVVDAAVGSLWIYFVAAYYYPRLTLPAPLPAVLLAAALVWTVLDVRRELQGVWRDRPLSYDPELSPAWNLWIDRGVEATGVALAVLLAVPAMAAAVAVVRRSLSATVAALLIAAPAIARVPSPPLPDLAGHWQLETVTFGSSGRWRGDTG